MKITFILPTVNMSGGIKVIAIYARKLADRGHEIVLISPPPPDLPLKRKIKSLLTGKGWPIAHPFPSHLDNLGLDHRLLDTHRAATDADVPDADVVIATWWETAEWVNSLSSAKGAKVYFIQHHELHDFIPAASSRATYMLPLHKIVIASWLRNLMRDEYFDHDVDLVPNSVDKTQFYSAVRDKQPVPTIGFLYHTSQYKGVDISLKVIRQLRDIFPDLRVIAFGSILPPALAPLPPYIEFHHAPRQDDIRNLYAQCDLWLTASRSEGFNLPAMEAMACRTPVVSTRAGWPEEAVITGHNGVLADVDDVNSLAQGAADILTLSHDAWRELSAHAYETVADSSWDRSTELFEAALRRACDKHQKKFPQSAP